MEFVHKVEKALEGPFGSLPALPKDAKEGLAKIWPWLALIGGVLQLLAAFWLWDWARKVDRLVDYVNSFSIYAGDQISNSRFSVWVWIGIAMLALDGIILLLAFPKLQKRQKLGWDLLFLGALINLVYGIVSLFIDGRGGFGSLLGAVIGSAIGFYLLFQVREKFGGKAVGVAAHHSETPKDK